MSKVPYTVNVDEYICAALDYLRKMHETRDYSGLMATVERIQYHANAMESALDRNLEAKWFIKSHVEDTGMTDTEFRNQLKTKMEKHND